EGGAAERVAAEGAEPREQVHAHDGGARLRERDGDLARRVGVLLQRAHEGGAALLFVGGEQAKGDAGAGERSADVLVEGAFVAGPFGAPPAEAGDEGAGGVPYLVVAVVEVAARALEHARLVAPLGELGERAQG